MTPRWLSKVSISESRRQVGPISDRFGFQNVSVDDILDHFGSEMEKSELRRQVDPILDHFASQNEWVDYILHHFGSFWIPGGSQEDPRRLRGSSQAIPGEPRRGPGGPRGDIERCLDGALGSQGRALAFERAKGRAKLAF